MSDLETLREIDAFTRELGLPYSVEVKWQNTRNRIGVATYNKATRVYLYVAFSRHVWPLMSPEERRLVVIHEVAHALTPAGEGHSANWRALCLSLGGNGKRCTDLPEETTEAVAKWKGHCPINPTHTILRNRLTARTRYAACGTCSPTRYNSAAQFVWSQLR